ncbi:MAG: hypothetical protein AAGF33_14290 [Pseudomonadota bacterium]
MTRPQEIRRPDTAFTGKGMGKKKKRRDANHLAFLRTLPCAVCGTTKDVEAAHVRAASWRHAKPITGLQIKPADWWAVPLCEWHHRLAPRAQHSMNELDFWAEHGIDPFTLATDLYAASGDREQALSILRQAKGKQ